MTSQSRERPLPKEMDQVLNVTGQLVDHGAGFVRASEKVDLTVSNRISLLERSALDLQYSSFAVRHFASAVTVRVSGAHRQSPSFDSLPARQARINPISFRYARLASYSAFARKGQQFRVGGGAVAPPPVGLPAPAACENLRYGKHLKLQHA